jgi:hypothetical protein
VASICVRTTATRDGPLPKFKDHYPWLVDDRDDSFGFIALHYLNHVEEVALPLDENGTVAFVRLVKPPLS